MSIARTGYTAGGSKRFLLGPGAVILNWGIPDKQRLLGISNGGNTFTPGVTYRDPESDRPVGMVRGQRIVDDIQPIITSNLMEVWGPNLEVMLPGLKLSPIVAAEVTANAALSNYVRYRMAGISDTDYIENVALVATMQGYADPFVGVIYNAIGGGDIELSLENKSETTIEATFMGTVTDADLEALAIGSKTLADIRLMDIYLPTESQPPAPPPPGP